MTLDDLISELQTLRQRYGGNITVDVVVDWLGRDRNESKQGPAAGVVMEKQGTKNVCVIQAEA